MLRISSVSYEGLCCIDESARRCLQSCGTGSHAEGLGAVHMFCMFFASMTRSSFKSSARSLYPEVYACVYIYIHVCNVM